MRFAAAIALSAFIVTPSLATETNVDDLLAPVSHETPGLAFAVVRDGELVISTAAGMADLTHGQAFQVDTPSNIGSTTKQFTAFAIALLADRGELSLDDPVSKYFADLPTFEHTVTLRHLLSHTSGYREMLNTLALAGWRLDQGDYIGPEAALKVVRHQPALQSVPGETWNYNNTGYVMLARVVEQVSGQSFSAFLDQEVFTPLGMDKTEFRSNTGQIIAGRAAGYAATESGFREVRDLSGADGAGGLYSTIPDLARWMNNLGDFELGGEAVRDMMTTPYALNDGETTDYGMGLFIDEVNDQVRWHHGGADIGHRSTFVFFPQRDAGYILLTNNPTLPGDLSNDLAARFLDFLADDESAEHTDDDAENAQVFDPSSLSGEQLERLTGRYELEIMPGFVLSVFIDDDGQLNVQGTNQPAIAVVATSETIFTADAVGARFEFHVAEDGSVPELTLHQGQAMKAKRLDDSASAEINLADYAGRYFSAELETFYTLRHEGDTLVLDHRRLSPIPLTHVEGETFTGAFPVINLRFERDDDGDIATLLAGNGRTLDVRFERWAQ